MGSAATTPTPTATQPALAASIEVDDRAAIRQRMEAAARARRGAPAASSPRPTSTSTVSAPNIAVEAAASQSSTAVGQDTGPSVAASAQIAFATEQPANPNTQTYSGRIDVPRLIPLFDTSNPSQPSPYARLFPSLMRANLFPDLPSTSLSSGPLSSSTNNALPLSIPDDISEDQLATLAEITKEGLETRLKLLSNTQETLNACMKQMQDAMNVLSGGEVQSVLKVVSELNQAVGSADKGKGRASEIDQ